ncbi:hypothetical protein M5D96_000698, partial [Drosophila gunungcola]
VLPGGPFQHRHRSELGYQLPQPLCVRGIELLYPEAGLVEVLHLNVLRSLVSIVDSGEHFQNLTFQTFEHRIQKTRRAYIQVFCRIDAFVVATGKRVEVVARIGLLVHEALHLGGLGVSQKFLDVRGVLVEIILSGRGCPGKATEHMAQKAKMPKKTKVDP